MDFKFLENGDFISILGKVVRWAKLIFSIASALPSAPPQVLHINPCPLGQGLNLSPHRHPKLLSRDNLINLPH